MIISLTVLVLLVITLYLYRFTLLDMYNLQLYWLTGRLLRVDESPMYQILREWADTVVDSKNNISGLNVNMLFAYENNKDLSKLTVVQADAIIEVLTRNITIAAYMGQVDMVKQEVVDAISAFKLLDRYHLGTVTETMPYHYSTKLIINRLYIAVDIIKPVTLRDRLLISVDRYMYKY